MNLMCKDCGSRDISITFGDYDENKSYIPNRLTSKCNNCGGDKLCEGTKLELRKFKLNKIVGIINNRKNDISM